MALWRVTNAVSMTLLTSIILPPPWENRRQTQIVCAAEYFGRAEGLKRDLEKLLLRRPKGYLLARLWISHNPVVAWQIQEGGPWTPVDDTESVMEVLALLSEGAMLHLKTSEDRETDASIPDASPSEDAKPRWTDADCRRYVSQPE